MITLSITVLFVLISVSEQQQPLANFDEYGQFIDNQGRRFYSPPRAVRELPEQYGYEVSNGKLIIKPCESRRSMPQNWQYPMQVNAPLAQPKLKDVPKKPLNNAIIYEQFSPPNTEAKQHEISSLLAAKPKPKPKPEPEPEKNNNYESESNDEAAEHIIKHNDAVPSHGNSQNHPLPVKDEKLPIPKATVFQHINKPNIKGKETINHNINSAPPNYVGPIEDPNEFIHSKKISASAPEIVSPVNKEPKIPEINCMQNKNSENTKDDDMNFAFNSRRSMGEMPDMRKGPITSRVPESTMKRILQQKLHKKDPKNSVSPNNDYDESNRYGYPSNLLPYSPGLLIASSPVPSRGGSVFDPTKGAGIAPLKESQLAMMESPRVCYACTTLNDPSCHYPQRGTTVKYCRQGRHSCLTKTVKGTSPYDEDLIVIRDCGELCDTASTASLAVSHSCSICNGDLCNDGPVDSGAASFTPLCALLVFIITWSIIL